jgi:hypothetical protein
MVQLHRHSGQTYQRSVGQSSGVPINILPPSPVSCPPPVLGMEVLDGRQLPPLTVDVVICETKSTRISWTAFLTFVVALLPPATLHRPSPYPRADGHASSGRPSRPQVLRRLANSLASRTARAFRPIPPRPKRRWESSDGDVTGGRPRKVGAKLYFSL